MATTAMMAMPSAAMGREGAMAQPLAPVYPSPVPISSIKHVSHCGQRPDRSFLWCPNRNHSRCCAGDVVGALLNRAEQTIAYFKNGIDLGTAFLGVAEEKLYPCVGMQTHEEEVTSNTLLIRHCCSETV